MVMCTICGNYRGYHTGLACKGCEALQRRPGRFESAMNYSRFIGKRCLDEGKAEDYCTGGRFVECLAPGMHYRDPKRRRSSEESSTSSSSSQFSFDEGQVFEQTHESCNGQVGPTSPHPDVIFIPPRNPSPAYRGNFGNIRRTVSQPAPPTPRRASVIARTGSPLLEKAKKPTESELESRVSLGSLVAFPKLTINDSLVKRVTSDSPVLQKTTYTLHDYSAQDKPVYSTPTFLNDYYDVIQQRGFRVENTLRAAAEARWKAFGDFLPIWDNFKREAERRRQLPPRANVLLNVMVGIILKSYARFIRRACRLFFQLPGFSDFDKSDQDTLLKEKFTECWLVCHAPYLGKNGEWHVLIGPNSDIHLSRYWMQQILMADHYEIMASISDEFNGIGLTRVEQILLLGVATFHPEFTTAKNKPFLSFLRMHYMECLLRSIRARCPHSQQLVTEMRLHDFMRLFRSLYRLGSFYVRFMSYARAPFCAIKDSVLITVTEALAKEDDGLQTCSDGLYPLSSYA